MVSGSVAVIIYGEPRLTHDVDLVVVLDREHAHKLREAFPEEEFHCPPEEVIRVEAAREQRGHFNLIHHPTGFRADMYLAGRDPLHEWAFAPARSYEIEGEMLVVAPPEYVIVRKLEYFREGGSEKHLRDVRSVLDTSPDRRSSGSPEARHRAGARRRLAKGAGISSMRLCRGVAARDDTAPGCRGIRSST